MGMEKVEIKQQLRDIVFHNPLLYTDEENLKWCWLRAVEWGEWPLFVGQLIGPILFLMFSWWCVAATIVILTWAWALIRYRFVSIVLAGIGSWVIILKWPASIGIGVYFLITGNYQLAIVSALWPVITLVLMWVTPRTKIGVIQTALMNRLGYEKLS